VKRLWIPDRRLARPSSLIILRSALRRQAGLVRIPRWPGGGPTSCKAAFVAAGSATYGRSQTTQSISLPSGWSVGQLCFLLAVCSSGNTLSSISPSGTWTQLISNSNYNLYYRILQSGDSAPTITWSATSVYCAQTFTYSSQNASHPIGAASSSFGQNSSSGKVVTCSAISTNYAYSKVLMFVIGGPADETSSSWSSTTIGGTADSQESSVNENCYSNSYVTLALFDLTQATKGTTGAGSATNSTWPYNYLVAALVEVATS
jgi:hypothetical protein